MVGSSPYASCKLLRRRCAKDCVFALYFPADDPHKFIVVHKVFGARNVSKMLQNICYTGTPTASKSRRSEQFSIRGDCSSERPGVRVRGHHIAPSKPSFTASNGAGCG
ncbi:hypothetical protein DH2020_022387 [Rehmannia glutinosa]|uniref:LOB domain-containing protein n=1 Tax=Rehmannia glutinosa TaxID=99300 RepID=A0ABR0WDP8_REHGL